MARLRNSSITALALWFLFPGLVVGLSGVSGCGDKYESPHLKSVNCEILIDDCFQVDDTLYCTAADHPEIFVRIYQDNESIDLGEDALLELDPADYLVALEINGGAPVDGTMFKAMSSDEVTLYEVNQYGYTEPVVLGVSPSTQLDVQADVLQAGQLIVVGECSASFVWISDTIAVDLDVSPESGPAGTLPQLTITTATGYDINDLEGAIYLDGGTEPLMTISPSEAIEVQEMVSLGDIDLGTHTLEVEMRHRETGVFGRASATFTVTGLTVDAPAVVATGDFFMVSIKINVPSTPQIVVCSARDIDGHEEEMFSHQADASFEQYVALEDDGEYVLTCSIEDLGLQATAQVRAADDLNFWCEPTLAGDTYGDPGNWNYLELEGICSTEPADAGPFTTEVHDLETGDLLHNFTLYDGSTFSVLVEAEECRAIQVTFTPEFGCPPESFVMTACLTSYRRLVDLDLDEDEVGEGTHSIAEVYLTDDQGVGIPSQELVWRAIPPTYPEEPAIEIYGSITDYTGLSQAVVPADTPGYWMIEVVDPESGAAASAILVVTQT